MKYLLDTHTALWWWTTPNKLPNSVLQAIINPNHKIFVSPVNLWEMSIKFHKGKFDEAKTVVADFESLMARNKFSLLPIKLTHVRLAGQFPQTHADPFDRMLVAGAISENLILISKDSKLNEFDVNLLW